MRILTSLAAMCAALSPVALSAEELAETAARFGALESVEISALSPSGTKMLYVSPGDGADQTIYVVDLSGGAAPEPITTSNEAMARITDCQWANEERIVCDIFGMQKVGTYILPFSRVIGMKSDGSDVTRLSADTHNARGLMQDGGTVLALDIEGEDGRILMTRDYVKEDKANTRLANNKEGLGVDLVDVASGRSRSVEKPNKMADRYLADEHGRVRVMSVSDRSGGFEGSDIRYLYRPQGSDEWQPLSEVEVEGSRLDGFVPTAVDSAKNVVYGFERENGFYNLYSMPLDGSGNKTLVKQVDGVDVNGLIRIGRSNRVIGVTYVTDARYAEYFDPEIDRLAKGLNKALPGSPQIRIVDASDDESVLLIQASSDDNPGMLYLYEKASGQLSELLPIRDQLDGYQLAEMKPVTYSASDGTQIPGYLTLPVGSDGKNLPAIVMPHGGPAARDEWGFDWLAQFFAARGYAVLQPNFRGSAGYGDQWFGRNGYQQWDVAVGDVNDAGRWLVSEGIADPSKMGIVGWSYGGYAALLSQVVDPELFGAVVAIAPVTDLNLLLEDSRGYTGYEARRRQIGEGPHVAAGSPARHADQFKAPVLLVHGSRDVNVSEAHSKLMRDRLQGEGKSVDLLEFDGLDHYLEHSQARRIMLKRIGEFLDTQLAN
ncbi:alpha/beta hydrolase family protein [Qipengyuania gelatinilytica]|uniref:S9 family peptidase n=1 Tax=Qipengyuania gelatinilytica TaxID=2867231 RepID=A0ABX9A1P4_9SPHN|nr:S9 family peptidase [Qipengyuania gelatinilytica]QZD95192.1 S9 family peptidase [Qipengyuania gelatinilytica]